MICELCGKTTVRTFSSARYMPTTDVLTMRDDSLLGYVCSDCDGSYRYQLARAATLSDKGLGRVSHGNVSGVRSRWHAV